MKPNDYIDGKFDEIGMTPAQKFCVSAHALVCVGAALGHRPFIKHDDSTYANLCMVLVGPTGSGKGTSHKFTNEIFSAFGEDIVAPLCCATDISSMRDKYKVCDKILSEPEREERGELRLHHVNEEFGGELRAASSIYQSKLPNAFCKLADGSKISERFGNKEISYPFIHYGLMAHITPEDVKKTIRTHLITGGCANRLIWCAVPINMTTPIPHLPDEVKVEIQADIRESMECAFAQRAILLDDEAAKKFDGFCNSNNQEKIANPGLFADMITRFPIHVKKTALILGMLRRQTAIDGQTMQDAINFILNTKSTIWNILPNAQATVEQSILTYVRVHGPSAPKDIFKALMERYRMTRIRSAINEMTRNGILRQRRIDKGDGNFPNFLTTD